ncbi:MAG TPA: response regulator, partial [Polyangiaceae bacterium]
MSGGARAGARADAHRVLIVEDHPDALAALVEIVEALGHEARVATTVEEALKAIEEEEFCYLIVDQELPLRAGAKA